MRPILTEPKKLAALVFLFALLSSARAQAPPSIQVFMPDGSLPPHELRFTLTSDDGLVETFFTDSKGRFLITRREGLRPDAAYTVTIRGDGRTYDTTTVSFKYYGSLSVYYIPIFLKPFVAPATKRAGAIDLAELDAETPKEARDAYDSALKSLRAGQSEEAIAAFKQAISVHPKYFRALNDLGVLYMKLKRYDEAAATLQRAIEIAPRVYYPQLNLAIVRTRQGKYKTAVELLERLHKDNPGLVQVMVPLADALMALNRLDEAEGYLRSVLGDEKLDRQTSGDARYKHGLLLNRKQRYDEAVKELTVAVRILPNSARTHLQLGGALLQVKRYDDAERELLAAYRLGGAELGAAQFLLGELYFIVERHEDAMRAFEQYLADVPQAPNSKEVQGLIDRIKTALAQK